MAKILISYQKKSRSIPELTAAIVGTVAGRVFGKYLPVSAIANTIRGVAILAAVVLLRSTLLL